MRIIHTVLLLAMSVLGVAAATAQTTHDGHDHRAATQDATWGVHGMVLFGGRDGLFASHLPLFHPPHDRQIILELAVDDAEMDAGLRAALVARPGQLWTLEPEAFALARLGGNAADPLRMFRATVVRGHFERGGEPVFRTVSFRVVRIIVDHRLDPTVRPAASATYDRIGQGDAQFLVKRQEGRPDFDHIVRVAADSCVPVVTVARMGVAAPTAAALAAAGHCRTPVGPTVYYEVDDLR